MRNLNELNHLRRTDAAVRAYYDGTGDETCGVFMVLSPTDGTTMMVVASIGSGWDHVSVSKTEKIPSWEEMEHVKRLFFKDDETAMQIHLPPTDHINVCDTCLHLWRPHAGLPLPQKFMV